MKHKQTFIAVSLLSLMLTACSGSSGISGVSGGGGGGSVVVDEGVLRLEADGNAFTTFLSVDSTGNDRSEAERAGIAQHIGILAQGDALLATSRYGIVKAAHSEVLGAVTATRTELSIAPLTAAGTQADSKTRLGLTGTRFMPESASMPAGDDLIRINGRDYVLYNVPSTSKLPPTPANRDIHQAAVVYGTSIDGTDANYHAFGYWLIDNDDTFDTSTNTQIVAFTAAHVDQRTPTSYFIATNAVATYRGIALGQYVDGSIAQRSFTGDLLLSTTFGGVGNFLNPVSGDIRNIKYAAAGLGAVPSVTTINLRSALTTGQPGGYFGQASDTPDDAMASAVVGSDTATGRWGGQFYGNEAQIVGGTFGVAIGDLVDDIGNTNGNAATKSWFGAFSGEKQ